MENVTLRTGKIVLLPLVKAVLVSLKSLFESNPIVGYELVMLCKDPKHELFGDTGRDLTELNLLVETNVSTYYVRDDVRDIVLASVEGEGLDMHLVNPVSVQTEQQQSSK